jgi:hypothetical protein
MANLNILALRLPLPSSKLVSRACALAVLPIWHTTALYGHLEQKIADNYPCQQMECPLPLQLKIPLSKQGHMFTENPQSPHSHLQVYQCL